MAGPETNRDAARLAGRGAGPRARRPRAALSCALAGAFVLAVVSGCGTPGMLSPVRAPHAVTVSSEPDGLAVYGPAVLDASGAREMRRIGLTPLTIPLTSGPEAGPVRLEIEKGDTRIPLSAMPDRTYHLILGGPRPIILENGKAMK